ncbi:hypothetical protein [Caulobacter mirabilis]|uniref:YbjN domain-containing protein n=1 Tax=Caulobacter mirabilis TaxID=69666 RepID=A0A2D2AV27_9CAUL|nr:hypothetical protein [Caulobacter mirabilis]ATQ41859.1 hypothetical protein CSW64_05245 [Caulobacter mirabilis]
MLKILAAATAFGLVATTTAVAQPASKPEPLMTDWALEDVRALIVERGETVSDSGVENGQLFVAGRTAAGMNFVAYGVGCAGTPVRCKGLNLTTGYRLSNSAEVDQALKQINLVAVGSRNGGDSALDLNRYVLFDGGIARANLKANIDVFFRLTGQVWKSAQGQ